MFSRGGLPLCDHFWSDNGGEHWGGVASAKCGQNVSERWQSGRMRGFAKPVTW